MERVQVTCDRMAPLYFGYYSSKTLPLRDARLETGDCLVFSGSWEVIGDNDLFTEWTVISGMLIYLEDF